MDQRQLFVERFDAPAERVWAATKRVLRTMGLREADDADRSAMFTTGATLTSWGEHMVAEVHGNGAVSELRVVGRPRTGLLTTRWGEDVHARGVRRDLRRAVEAELLRA